MAEMLVDMNHLERLTLSWNNIGGGAGPAALRAAIEEGTALHVLDLEQCSLVGPGG